MINGFCGNCKIRVKAHQSSFDMKFYCECGTEVNEVVHKTSRHAGRGLKNQKDNPIYAKKEKKKK